jgi:hypothetical protein
MTLIVFREQYKCLCSSKFICECKGKAGREADHSRPSSAEVEEWVDLYLHSPNTPSWRGAQLGGAQGQLNLLFYKGKDKWKVI